MSNAKKAIQAAAGAGGAAESEYVVGAFNEFVTLFDFSTPGTLSRLTSFTASGSGNVRGTEFSPDNSYIAISNSDNNNFELLDHTTPGSLSLAATYNLAERPTGAIAWSPDGNYIVVGTDHGGSGIGVTVLDHTTPGSLSLASTYSALACRGADFSSDGAYLVTAHESSFGSSALNVFSHSSGSITRVASNAAGGPQNYNVRFSPDDNYIASGHNGSGSFSFLSWTPPSTLTKLTGLSHPNTVQAVAWNPDGDYLATGFQNTSPYFRLLDHTTPGTLSIATTYTVGGNTPQDIAFSASGEYIAIQSHGGGSGRITILDHTTPGSLAFASTYTAGSFADGVSFSKVV